MKKKLSLIVAVLILLSLIGCSKKIYQLPWDHFCYSADGISVVELDAEAKDYIIDLLNEGEWYDDLAKCSTDYKFSAQEQSLGYNCEEGIFNDFTLEKSLKLSEEVRLIVNEFLGYNKAEPKPTPEEEVEEDFENKPENEPESTPENKPENNHTNDIDFTPDANAIYNFEELFSISEYIDVNLISKIKIDRSNISVGGYPVLHDVSITTDRDVIDSVIDFINNSEFTLGAGGLDGGGANKITLFEGENSFEFTMTGLNDFYLGYYSFTSSIEYPFRGLYNESYYYIEALNIKLSSYGDIISLPDFDLSEICLNPVFIDFYAHDFTKDADLIVDGEIIKIISQNTIETSWGYFNTVGEKNFAEIIPENESSSVIMFENENGQEIGRAFVSSNTVYTVDEIVEMLHFMSTGISFEIFNSDGSAFTDREFNGYEILTVHVTPRC